MRHTVFIRVMFTIMAAGLLFSVGVYNHGTPGAVMADSTTNLSAPKHQSTADSSTETALDDSEQPQDAARRQQTRVASANVDACLKRFVDECVRIQPGSPPFPKEFPFGPHGDAAGESEARLIPMLHPFRISRYETTQELYAAVMGQNPSRWKGTRNSAESMTVSEAVMFCRKLTAILQSKQRIDADEIVRLPTEKEWEYCCRAGTTTRYSFGDAATTQNDQPPQASVLDEFAWHTGNAAGNDPAVGVLRPNNWGLYDMHGYLWEFVVDESTIRLTAPTDTDAESNAAATPATDSVIIRGGSWKEPASRLTSTSRRLIQADLRDDGVGFRCVIAKKPVPQR